MNMELDKNKAVEAKYDIIQEISTLEKLKADVIQQAYMSGDADAIIKANEYLNGRMPVKGISNPKSLFVDPLGFSSNFKYKDRPTVLSYEMLRRMTRVPIISSVLTTRENQVKRFAQYAESRFSLGFQVVMTNKKAKPKKVDQKNMEKLTQVILDCGFGGYVFGRDDFSTFLSKLTRDTLTYDQMTFEVVDNYAGRPAEWFATDASTFRIATVDDRMQDDEELIEYYDNRPYKPAFVQVLNMEVQNYFYPWELCFGVRNARTDLRVQGYGYAETEDLVDTITSMLWADEYNRRFFSHGSAPKGLIKVAGQVPEDKLLEFRREWQTQMAGVYNSWKTPIMHADNLEWIDLMKSNKEMEYKAWLEYLIKIVCAKYTISPTEIGFDLRGSADFKPAFESKQESLVKYSQDKGLAPLMVFLEQKINRHIIWRIDPRYSIKFFGISSESRNDVVERLIKEVAYWKKVDEARAELDLEPLGEENGGNLILNPVWMQNRTNERMMEQQQQQELMQQFYGEGQGREGYDYDEKDEEQKKIKKGFNNKFTAEENPFIKQFDDFVENLNKTKN